MDTLIIILLALALYFVPTIVAYRRDSDSFGLILLVNIIAGWTLIGWLAILIWAAEGKKSSEA